jgi:hypothetical protein
MPPDTIPPEGYITLPIPQLLNLLISPASEWVEANSEDKREVAFLLSKLDNEERFCHIEFPSENQPLTKIWRLDGWKVSYDRRLIVAAKSAEERKERFYRDDKIQELRRAIVARIGLSEDKAIQLASLIWNRKNTVAAMSFGVKI